MSHRYRFGGVDHGIPDRLYISRWVLNGEELKYLAIAVERYSGTDTIFDVCRDRKSRNRPPKTMDYYVLEAVDWVNVIPITTDGEVVLIKLYRHGINTPSLEIPGGMIDPEDISPMAAAERELREETGYESNPLQPLGVVHPNPAIQNNRCYTFLAPNAHPAGEPDPDEGEEITVIKYPVTEVPGLLKEGKITHSLVIAAFLWFYMGDKT